MSATADIRYGRRGGRWASPDAGRHRHAVTHALQADPGKGKDRTTCAVCRRSFTYRTGRKTATTPPAICGQIHCRARHTWGPDDWAGRARMATARLAAGRPPDELDHEALARTGRPHQQATGGQQHRPGRTSGEPPPPHRQPRSSRSTPRSNRMSTETEHHAEPGRGNAAVIARQSDLLRRVAQALTSESASAEPPDYSDLPNVARRTVANLKRARAEAHATHAALGRLTRITYETARVVAGDTAGHREQTELPDLVANALGRPRDPDPIVPQPSGKHPEYFVPKVVRLGEDGRYAVAYGHLNPTFFACLTVAAASDCGYGQALAEALDRGGRIPLEHTYALERTAPAGDEDVDWEGQPRPGERSVEWGDPITADTAGAFPVTAVDLEAVV